MVGIAPIYGEIGDGLLLFYQHYWEMVYHGTLWDHNNLMESLCDLNGIVMLMGNRAISKTPSPPFILNTHVHEWTQIWFLLLLNHGFWGGVSYFTINAG